MAAGDISGGSLKLLEGATATNGAPTLATDGHEVNPLLGVHRPQAFAVKAFSTAGSLTMTVTLKLWGYDGVAGKWAPIGTHATDADRGKLNAGNAIGEVAADTIAHTERVEYPLATLSRLYVEVVAIGGTATAIDAYAVIDK